jgi:hypothetical protein
LAKCQTGIAALGSHNSGMVCCVMSIRPQTMRVCAGYPRLAALRD